jgi:hypothetical protein
MLFVVNICFKGGLCGEALGIARSLRGRLLLPHGDGRLSGDTEWVALPGGLSINHHQKLPVRACDSIPGQGAKLSWEIASNVLTQHGRFSLQLGEKPRGINL